MQTVTSLFDTDVSGCQISVYDIDEFNFTDVISIKDNKALETVKKVGGSVKYFGVHCGYFCTNVYRMIKRKNAAKKRKKAEEIRREQRRRKEALARQQRERQANGELVQVRSRNDRRPVNSKSVQRHSSQKRRPNHSHNKK